MKIGIDARFLTHPQCGGFKTYTECLVAALAQVDPVNQYVLYLDRAADQTTALPVAPNFATRLVGGALPLLGMPWREQICLRRQVARDRLDVLHSPSLTAPLHIECPLVLTLHDMIWYLPNKYSDRQPTPLRRRLMAWYYKQIALAATRSAKTIVTVSQASKADIVRMLGVAEDSVIVTHEAARPIFRRVRESRYLQSWREQHGLPSEFVLAVAAADPRKNIQTLVRAYALLPSGLRSRFPLVIGFGHELLTGALRQIVAKLGLDSQVLFWRLGPAAEDMALLYNAASLFVFPSLYEGFGLPPLEAMACGTPVIAADNSSMPEVLGDAALFVEARDKEALAAATTRALTDDGLRANLIERGLERASRFSWERCARETMAAYARSAGMDRNGHPNTRDGLVVEHAAQQQAAG